MKVRFWLSEAPLYSDCDLLNFILVASPSSFSCLRLTLYLCFSRHYVDMPLVPQQQIHDVNMPVGSQKHMSTTAAPLFARSEAAQHQRDVGKTFLQVPPP